MITGANAPGTAMLARIACREIPVVQHHHASRDHVRRHGSIRNRQAIEVGL